MQTVLKQWFVVLTREVKSSIADGWWEKMVYLKPWKVTNMGNSILLKCMNACYRHFTVRNQFYSDV